MDFLNFSCFKVKNDYLNNEDKLINSKLMGVPVFPLNFFDAYGLDTFMFIGMINLEQIKMYNLPLPKEGFIYFFLDIDESPMVPKVIYCNQPLAEAAVDFNDYYDEFGHIDAYHMKFCEGTNQFLGEFTIDNLKSITNEDYVCLLKIDKDNLPEDFPIFDSFNGPSYYLIKKDELKDLNFNNVIYIGENV